MVMVGYGELDCRGEDSGSSDKQSPTLNFGRCRTNGPQEWRSIDVSYAALQAHGIVNVALHREYSPGIVFIFSQGRKYLYHV
jgi:hypothetical protein